MKTTIIAVVLSASAAFVAATWVYSPSWQKSPAAPDLSFDPGLPIDERIAALELAVSQEQLARQLLQDEIFILTAELEELTAGAEPDSQDTGEELAERRTEMTAEARREMLARRNSPEGRADRLIEAGIEPGLASWIVHREQELQMESLQARFEAGRSGDPADFYREQFSTSSVLREELGDADYERYLEASGRSVSVAVSSVIGSSPAQSAGLQPGDEITRYAGERVFSMSDINQATMEGQPGQSVVVDIVRDGVPMQVVIPRGPLGITGGRSRRR